MNIIQTHPIKELGYNFIKAEYIPEGLDEYHLRNIQNAFETVYHSLTPEQINLLESNLNTSDDWTKIMVAEDFDASLVRNTKFYGLVRIGTLQPMFKEFHDFRMAAGICNSTIISCDIGNNVCIDNVHYLSHFIVEDDVMISNVNELATTNYSKFGNGVVKEGESESVRTYVEVCNENGGRNILPFNGMLAGDAYMWSRFRDDELLLERFKEMTDHQLDNKRGYYGKIGERTVIKNCGILKDIWIGSDAYLKGATKIKNVTINSDVTRKSQIGEGCELVNGIVGYGCRIFYGVKAVRFVLSSHSQLKYGARLINSFLGNNSTISCCEVLNTLIFPSHEQHHNNSFLCAALVMGQSNMAAGATIGSNHNSRSADGEIIAGRGFWPGLCVSLKHNSKFASFTIIAKGDFPSEINIPVPFSLVSLDEVNDHMTVMPAYWFMYNMYAMERNAWKTKDRDQRTEKIQRIEYEYLAPDTINEIFSSLKLFASLNIDEEGNAAVDGWENSRRKTILTKVPQAIRIFNDLVSFYATTKFIAHIAAHDLKSFDDLKASLTTQLTRAAWVNVGGQLITTTDLKKIKDDVKSGAINSWTMVHNEYKRLGIQYEADTLQHAYTSFLEIKNITAQQFTAAVFRAALEDHVRIKEWMCKCIYDSRAKDYSNPFRKMVYETNAEMNKVLGKLEDNSFIQSQMKELDLLRITIKKITADLKLI